ncbi:MAG: segregation/condensation protein A [Spirochaetales bacterium]|nr:segregation/condensation protein A [Spirochaetales bacterium]
MIDEDIIEETQAEPSNASFKVEKFEGPLDLLLFLIKKNEVSIYDIPIFEITEQFVQYVRDGKYINLENLTEFYIMTATLIYIKSQMLLPIEVNLDEEIDDPRQELVEKLIEYQKFKKLTDLMEEKEKESEWMLERSKKQRMLPFPDSDEQWEKLDVWELLQSFSHMMSSISYESVYSVYEEVSINEKITLMNELFEKQGDISFVDLLGKNPTIMDVICSFLAILDSVKYKRIEIYQNKFFGDIKIAKLDTPDEYDLYEKEEAADE